MTSLYLIQHYSYVTQASWRLNWHAGTVMRKKCACHEIWTPHDHGDTNRVHKRQFIFKRYLTTRSIRTFYIVVQPLCHRAISHCPEIILLLVKSHITPFTEPYGTADSPVCFIHASPSFQKQSPVKLARLWTNNKKRTYELSSIDVATILKLYFHDVQRYFADKRILREYIFDCITAWCLDRNLPVELCQYMHHDCWFPDSLCRQVRRTRGLVCVK